MRTFVGIYWDMVENVRNTRRLYQESYDPNTNVIGYDNFGHSIQHCYHCQDSGTITTIHLRTNRALSYKPVTNLLFVYKHVLYQHPGAILAFDWLKALTTYPKHMPIRIQMSPSQITQFASTKVL